MFSLMFPLVNDLVLLAREQVLVMQLVELGQDCIQYVVASLK